MPCSPPPPKSTIIQNRRRRRRDYFRKRGHVSLESDIANAHGAHPESVFPLRLITTIDRHVVDVRRTGEIANWPPLAPGRRATVLSSSLSGRTTFFCGCLGRGTADLHSRRYGSSFQERTSLLLREDPNLRGGVVKAGQALRVGFGTWGGLDA